MKYKCVNKCYFGKRVYEVGEIAEFDSLPSRHFVIYNEGDVVSKPVVRDIMAAIPYEFGKFVKPDGGMGAKIDIDVPKPMQTAGSVKAETIGVAVTQELPNIEKIDKRTKAWKAMNK